MITQNRPQIDRYISEFAASLRVAVNDVCLGATVSHYSQDSVVTIEAYRVSTSSRQSDFTVVAENGFPVPFLTTHSGKVDEIADAALRSALQERGVVVCNG